MFLEKVLQFIFSKRLINNTNTYPTYRITLNYTIKSYYSYNTILLKNSLWHYVLYKNVNKFSNTDLLRNYISYYNKMQSPQNTKILLNILLVLSSPKPLIIRNYINYFKKYKTVCKQWLEILFYNLKWIILALLLAFLYFFISIFYIQVDLTKQLVVWYVLFVVYYLLISTFNSFLIKYRYGKFTSAIQRFWKRTGMIFWLIEGFLFLLFFYYFLNSSQEPLYMFDYSSLNQEYLIQLKTTYKNMILLSLGIYLGFILIFNLNYLIFYQNILLLTSISLIIFYTLYIESYQFIYIINIFSDKEWNFDEEDQSWSLEIEENNLRVKQQYFILCLIAKYWHFIFIFISWFFFYIKSLELGFISITMLGYNIQNLLVLYVLNFMCLIQWAKFIFKKFLEITYYWFFIQYDEKFYLSIVVELWNTVLSFFYLENHEIVIDNFNRISNILFGSSDFCVWKI